MKNFLHKFLILLLISFLIIPLTHAQEEDEEVEDKLDAKDVIKIKNEKKLHKLDRYDTEIIKYTIELDDEVDYTVVINSVPDDILDITEGENEFSVHAKKVGSSKVTLMVKLEDEETSYSRELNFQVREEKGQIKFNQDTFYLVRDLSFVVDFEVTPKDLDLSRIVWESSVPSIATVENGKVFGHKLGQTTITASLDGHTETMQVYVTAPLQKIEFNPNNVSVNLNETVSIPDLIYVPYDTTSDKTATLHVEDENIAVIEEGVIRGLEVGTTNVIATVNGIRAHLEVEVIEKSIDGDTHTLLLENTGIDDEGFHLNVRDFSGLKKKEFDLYLPTQEILEYMENREFSRLLVHLDDELLSNNLRNLNRFSIDKDILLQLGAQKLEVVFTNLNNDALFKAYFSKRVKESVNLVFDFEKISVNDSLYSIVNNTHAFKLFIKEDVVDGFSFAISNRLLESEDDQYHFLYTLDKETLTDTEQKVKADEDGFVKFDLNNKENIISLSPIALVKHNFVIYTFIGIIVLISVGVLVNYSKRLRKKS